MGAAQKSCSRSDEVDGEFVKTVQQHDGNGCGLSARHTIILLLSIGLGIVHFLRYNLSVAMIAMVNENEMTSYGDHNTTDSGCPMINVTKTNRTRLGEFDWDPPTQGFILSSFFYGYCVLQIPGAWLATRYGAKRVIGGNVLLVSALSLLTPLAARTHPGALMALRVMEGLLSGSLFPCVHTLIGRWAPVNERAKLITLITPGVYVGTVASFMATGWLCEQSFLGGWPAAFYIPGVLGCLWCVVWVFIAYDSPLTHPRISRQEYDLIMDSVGENVYTKLPVPWLSMLTSRSFWAVCVAFVCNEWGSVTLQTELPSYLKAVLGVDVKQSGFLSSLPYLAAIPAALLWGYLADVLREKKVMEVTNIRKLFNTIATLGPASLLVLSTFIGCNEYLIIAVISASKVIQTADLGGSNPNMIDIAPHLAGIIKALCNTLGQMAGIISPYLTGLLVDKGETKSEWSKIFYIAAGVLIFDALYYLLFASSKLEPWATPKVQVEVVSTDKQTNRQTLPDNISISSDTPLLIGSIQ